MPEHSFSAMRSLLSPVSFLAAALFTIILNSATLIAFLRDEGTLLTVAPSVDEQFYAAQIASVGHGSRLGDVPLAGHDGEPVRGSYAPIVQGMMMRLFGWELETVLLIGDVLFPFFIGLLLISVLSRVVPSPGLAALLAFVVMAQFDLGWLRTINPQFTFLPVTGYLAAFLAPRPHRRHYFLRGGLVGLMLFTHVLHASFFLLIEFCDAIRVALRSQERPGIMRRILALSSAFLPWVLLFFLLQTSDAHSLASADTLRRSGIISSRLPAAPVLQGMTFVVTALLLMLDKRGTALREIREKLLVLLMGSLLALNQSLLHGVDAIFGLYYRPVILLILAVVLAHVFLRMMPLRFFFFCIAGICILSFASMIHMEKALKTEQQTIARTYRISGIPKVIGLLHAEKTQRVVLAPLEIANLIPVMTGHRVLFNKYALYQRVTDGELARRYALQEALFPTSMEARGEGYNSVFGLAAGNLAARERSHCRLWNLVRAHTRQCDVSIASHVHHKEVYEWLDAALRNPASLDLPSLFREFQVRLIVTHSAQLPGPVADICPEERMIGEYVIYDCKEG